MKIDQSESLLVVVCGEIITLACALSDDAARRKTRTCGGLPGAGGEYLNSYAPKPEHVQINGWRRKLG